MNTVLGESEKKMDNSVASLRQKEKKKKKAELEIKFGGGGSEDAVGFGSQRPMRDMLTFGSRPCPTSPSVAPVNRPSSANWTGIATDTHGGGVCLIRFRPSQAHAGS